MDLAPLALVGTGILGYGLISKRAEDSVLTPPIFFVGVGVAAAALGLVHGHLDGHLLHLLAEVTLVLVLFTDASRIGLPRLRREHDLPVRLLVVGMPLTIGLGTLLAAWSFPQFTLWQAALLAAVLAPTDAALGQAVVSSPKVPVRIRQALNVESGLNDGIALPLVLLFLSACSSAVPGQGGTEYWMRFAALQVTLGPLVGVAVGWAGSRAVDRAVRTGWMSATFAHLSSLGLALLAFAGAEAVGGNGFIAAFVAGLTLGNVCSEGLKEQLHEFAEAEGQLLTLLVFLIFGGLMVPDALATIGPKAIVFGVLALTVMRMLPVAISLIGTGLRWPTVAFLGWFGPRGIASVLFGLLVVESSILEPKEELFSIVVVTVLLSVVAHGLTANPLSNAYARYLESRRDIGEEHQDVTDHRVRIRHAR